jgi:hypothetical protein
MCSALAAGLFGFRAGLGKHALGGWPIRTADYTRLNQDYVGGRENLTQKVHVCRRYVLCTRDPLYIANGRSRRYKQFWVQKHVLRSIAGEY